MTNQSPPADPIRIAMMNIAENLVPFHELADGEVAYFVRQGFTDEQARAMVAAEFVAVFCRMAPGG